MNNSRVHTDVQIYSDFIAGRQCDVWPTCDMKVSLCSITALPLFLFFYPFPTGAFFTLILFIRIQWCSPSAPCAPMPLPFQTPNAIFSGSAEKKKKHVTEASDRQIGAAVHQPVRKSGFVCVSHSPGWGNQGSRPDYWRYRESGVMWFSADKNSHKVCSVMRTGKLSRKRVVNI